MDHSDTVKIEVIHIHVHFVGFQFERKVTFAKRNNKRNNNEIIY